ncbi:ComEC/Rec2 family competence protein [Shigella boydii]
MVALVTWGMLKLSGRQWSGWDVWIRRLAVILLMVSSCCHSRKSLWLSAAAVAALIFWYQWFPCPELAAAAGIACSRFPLSTATGNHTSAYARADRHISWH